MERLILPIIIIVGLILSGAYFGGIYYQDKLDAAHIEAQLNKGDAVKADQEVKLGLGAAKVYEGSVYRARELDRIHTENEENIQSSIGADVKLSTSYIDATNNGLCRYESTVGCPSSASDRVLPTHP